MAGQMSMFNLQSTCRQSGLTGKGPRPLMPWCTDPSCPAYVRSLERRYESVTVVFGTCLPLPHDFDPVCGGCPWHDRQATSAEFSCRAKHSPHCGETRRRDSPACALYREAIVELRERRLREGPRIETPDMQSEKKGKR
jgi:hypothetical protein